MKLNYCETVNIENCEVYSSITTCSKCLERYNLVDGKYCELMKPTSYCLESIVYVQNVKMDIYYKMDFV